MEKVFFFLILNLLKQKISSKNNIQTLLKRKHKKGKTNIWKSHDAVAYA